MTRLLRSHFFNLACTTLVLALWTSSAYPAAEGCCPPQEVSVVQDSGDSVAYNALYRTVAGYIEVSGVKVSNQQKLKLCVPGFKDKVRVQAVLQREAAPLVVMLPGISAYADTDFGQLWPSWFAAAGYHVLSLDSAFTPEFVRAYRKGPGGNVWSEAQGIAQIVSAFLALPQLQARVSKIGIVGMSYGGTEALVLGVLAQQGKLPFEVSAIQAWSPPVDLRHTAAVLDRWYDEERPKYTLWQLQFRVGWYDFNGVKCGDDAPSESMLKAAIAASFHEALVPIVMANDQLFCLKLLQPGDRFTSTFARREQADRWGFQDYADRLAIPYWDRKFGEQRIDRLIDAAHLCNLLRQQPPYTLAFLAADDPFIPPQDKEDLKACENRNLVSLPSGGHLGYISQEQTKQRLLAMFEMAEERQVAVRK